MALEFKLTQKLSQSLVMTPQLRQAIKLLHLGRIDYLEMISTELESNPVLEVADKLPEKSSASSTFEFPREIYPTSRGAGSGNLLENTIEQEEGLSEHLLWQLRMTDLQGAEFEAASYIIGNLNNNGYLSVPLGDVAQQSGLTLERVEAVLQEVQSFDPIGIAARDLRECLLLQLEYEGFTNSLVWNVVDKHLSKVEHGKLDDIASEEGVTIAEVVAAVEQIRKLEPRPARPFVSDTPIYIIPDVYVRRIGEEYIVAVNDSGIPKLRLNPEYKQLLDSKVFSPTDGDYLKEKLKAAAWLIKSIEQRQNTIYRVTKSIMRHQREFLEKGTAALKPLILKDIAADVGLHQSTISRVTTNKFVHTPQGVFELKFFFSSRLRTENGDAVSSESVRKRIQELIDSENPKKPFSDQALATMLASEGVEIARRTVAKYRESMDILSSSRRKKKY